MGKVTAKPRKAAPTDELVEVRTTFDPSKVLYVDAGELLEFERQGLIYTGDAPAPSAEDDEADSDVDETGIGGAS